MEACRPTDLDCELGKLAFRRDRSDMAASIEPDNTLASALDALVRLVAEERSGAISSGGLEQSASPVEEKLHRIASELHGMASERELFAEQLIDRERQHRAMLAAIPDLVFVVGADGRIIDCHGDDLLAFFGRPEEVRGQPIDRLWPAPIAEELNAALKLAIQCPGQVQLVRYSRSHTTNRYFEARCVAASPREAGDLAVLIVRDVTDWRLHEESLQRARLRAEVASRAKSAFLANMSHKLRTPLNAVIGFSELLQQQHFGELNEKQETFVGSVLSSGEELLGLINDLLDLARIEAGEVELDMHVMPIREVLRSVIVSLEPEARAKNVRLELDLPEMSELVRLDPARFAQLSRILLANAIGVTASGGQVSIRAALSDRTLRLSIEDEGPGYDDDQLERLNEAFDAPADRFNDTSGGVDLALVLSLVRLHGGTLAVERRHEGGCLFTVEVPSGLKRTFSQWSPDTDGRLESAVLVVDDDPGARSVLASELASMGFAVFTARSGEEAIERIESRSFSAVTLDLLMPGIDGWEVLDRLRVSERAKGVPVIMVSSTAELQPSEGLAAIVRKPISGARLREVFADIGVGFVDLVGVRLATIGNRTEELVLACSTLVRAGCQSPEQVVVGGLPADDCQVALLDLGEHPQASGWLRELAERRPRLTIVGLHDEGVAPVVSTADVVTVTRSLVAESPGRVVRLVAGWLSEQKTREAE